MDNDKYLRLNEQELLEKVQAKGEQVWDSVAKMALDGKSHRRSRAAEFSDEMKH